MNAPRQHTPLLAAVAACLILPLLATACGSELTLPSFPGLNGLADTLDHIDTTQLGTSTIELMRRSAQTLHSM